jgi:hypothetical protein
MLSFDVTDVMLGVVSRGEEGGEPLMLDIANINF